MVWGKAKTIRLTSGYRFTIPKDIRAELGLMPRQRFVMREEEGTILLVPLPEDPVRHLRGQLGEGPSVTEELLRERTRDLEHE
jgi:bifunctional DNA-binding transcriptional regulator/antitoxin component of YhaV-PrlF toxin-antitoxin module